MATLTFLEAFGLITLQDGGRAGLRHRGVPLGGYADAVAARRAQALVGSLTDLPTFEFAQASAKVHFSEATEWAWCGAAASLSIDGAGSLACGRRHRVAAGAVLAVRGPYRARYGYLALGGQVLSGEHLGSVSPLRLGTSWVPVESVVGKGASFAYAITETQTPAASVAPAGATTGRITLWPGPEADAYSRWLSGHPTLLAHGIPRLTDMHWAVDADSNRVGLRLRHRAGARAVGLFGAHPIRSSPTVPGTVQVTPGGQLIVSLADGPTMGGYPRIGLVDPEELGTLAQCTGTVRFRYR